MASPTKKSTNITVKSAPPLTDEVMTELKLSNQVQNAKAQNQQPNQPDVADLNVTIDQAINLGDSQGLIDDPISDAVINEMSSQESDQLITDQDEENIRKPLLKNINKKHRSKRFFKRKLFWLLIVLIIIGIIAIVPYSRYKILALFVKQNYSVHLIDSKTNTPISNALVSLDGKKIKTNANGFAKLNIPIGYGVLNISKQYYENYSINVLIPLSAQKKPNIIKLQATGRQVPIKVINTISKQPIIGASISLLNTSATTNSNGSATIVLPTQDKTYKAVIKSNGYNNKSVTVTVTPYAITSNSFAIDPSGQVYFLSNSNGKVNVVSSNYDGNNQQVILAGTGNEKQYSTTLYHSLNWQYLMLFSQRSSISGSHRGLYLINPVTKAYKTINDGTTATLTPIGWSGNYFLYVAYNQNLPSTSAGQYVIYSFNAATGQNITLDQSQSAVNQFGNSTTQSFSNFNLVNNSLIYAKTWSPLYVASTNFISSINSIAVSGNNQKTLEQFSSQTDSFINNMTAVQYAPSEFYYIVSFNNAANSTNYYSYSNGQMNQVNISASQVDNINYTPADISPSGTLAIFTSYRNGQLVLLEGSPTSNNNNQKQIAVLPSSYSLIGWLNNNYLLLSSKNNLMIMPASGLVNNIQPTKVSGFTGIIV